MKNLCVAERDDTTRVLQAVPDGSCHRSGACDARRAALAQAVNIDGVLRRTPRGDVQTRNLSESARRSTHDCGLRESSRASALVSSFCIGVAHASSHTCADQALNGARFVTLHTWHCSRGGNVAASTFCSNDVSHGCLHGRRRAVHGHGVPPARTLTLRLPADVARFDTTLLSRNTSARAASDVSSRTSCA